jgi:hypothetical protein
MFEKRKKTSIFILILSLNLKCFFLSSFYFDNELPVHKNEILTSFNICLCLLKTFCIVCFKEKLPKNYYFSLNSFISHI